MNVLILGATGMVGQGVMRECLLDDGVARVVTLGRHATGNAHAKVREIVHADLFHLAPIEPELTGLDACFYCLGATAAGKSEAEYARINYDMTLAVAEALARLDPDMTFVYVSGMGTDSTERGRTMWARVKGTNGERAAPAAVQGGVHAPAGHYPPDARDQIEDDAVSGVLCAHDAAVSGTAFALPSCDHDHRASRPSDAQARALGLLEAGARER